MRVKMLLLCLVWTFALHCPADDMKTDAIKQLVHKMDDSLSRGHIYHITYSWEERRTESFYAYYEEMIKLLEDNRVEATKNMNRDRADDKTRDRNQEFLALVDGFKRHLKYSKQFNSDCDYNVDGVGFYLKEKTSFPQSVNPVIKPTTTLYSSDGKIMGIFYLDDSQAVIQPATERPPTLSEHWSDLAYLYSGGNVSSYIDKFPLLTIKPEEASLMIHGTRQRIGQEKTEIELRIDKTSLKPLSITSTYYNSRGQLDSRIVKTWQFKDFHGVSLPEKVVDQYYQRNLRGELNLMEERVFNILDFSPESKSAKDLFKGLLKSNYSVYDEITGSHYMTGNPEEMLNNLSR